MRTPIAGMTVNRGLDPYGCPSVAFSVWVQSRRLGWRMGVGAFVRGDRGRGLVNVIRPRAWSESPGWQVRLWRVAVAARRLTAFELCAQPSTDGAEVGQ